MAVRPYPDAATPLLGDDGKSMNPIWYAYFQSRQAFASAPDVSTVAPTNGQVLIYNATTRAWVPGAN